MLLATTITINGLHGTLLIIAAIFFAAAAIAAWVVQPRNLWAILVAAGLLLWVLTGLIH